jgi:hypothetical protein
LKLLVIGVISSASRLGQEDAVVPNVIDHPEVRLALRHAEAAAELLLPDHAGLGRSQHEHGVDGGHIDAFVEHVDGEDDIDAAR